MSLDRELIRGSLEVMILSLLTERPLYGYLIQKRVAEASHGSIEIQEGTLYRLLHRLEALGLIKSRWDASTGRKRKWYQITRKGQRTLKQHLSDWKTLSDCVNLLARSARKGLQNIGGSEAEDSPLPA